MLSELRDRAEYSVRDVHDCADLRSTGISTSGLYDITLAGRTVKIWCDMTSEGKSWLVSFICTFPLYLDLNIPLCAFRTQSQVNMRSKFSFWSL